ncbi:Ig-like domain-containing protein [Polaribacter pectinis]|uniref:Ig-like domain-containing protein n=1 Tax=Polaribacter pectinis TaxID=2738844 RepID=A0A7G9LA24_9FLAO|nr:Ig-like domain-containing protein [Polaribacter pectinis]QNM85473.1 Ig-like domain-containing protein [Polaribacter pectinis]
MKHLSKLFYITFLLILVSNCARTGRPEGGPKDEDAPLFVTSNPPYETTNFNKKEIEIEFDEYVKLKDLNKQLIVSPPLKNPALITPQGTASKTIKIKILDTLTKNTTYIFNFGNAIEDNNENNKLEAFKYVFSTGNYIDSLITSGKIKDAYLNETPKNINVLLYRIDSAFTDSIIYKKKPNYVANTLDTTNFNFSNLKKGKYLMIALKETSSDYIFNPKTDKIGFYNDTISLPKDSIIEKPIVIFNELQPYKFRRGKEISKGKIVFGYEGEIENLNIKIQSDVPKDFKSISKFEINKDTLNYWFTPFEADSLNFIVSNANFLDTITVNLRKKKIDSLTINSTISNTLHLRDTLFLKTNNPIIELDTSKISITDKDTIAVPFSSYLSSKENKIAVLFDKKQKQSYSVTILPDAFKDIFKQPNDTLKYNLKTRELEDYGKITLNIINDNSNPIIIELVEGKDKNKLVERRFITKSETLIFDLLQPKTYYIRAIIDTNKNNKWDTGNYLLKQLPEEIIYYNEELEVRANYFINNTFTINK